MRLRFPAPPLRSPLPVEAPMAVLGILGVALVALCLLPPVGWAQDSVSAGPLPGTADQEEAIASWERQVDSLQALRPARGSAESLALGVALRELAGAYWATDRFDEGLQKAEEALAILEGAGAPGEEAEALNRVGLFNWSMARYEVAVEAYLRARDLWLAADDRENLGRVNNNLGTAHYQWGNYELALEAYLESLAYRRESEDRRGQGLVLANVGLVYHDWGQYAEAREVLAESVGIARELDDSSLLGYALQTLGSLHLTLGELDEAEAAFVESSTHFRDGQVTYSAAGLGLVRQARGDFPGAVQLLQGLLVDARATSQPRHEARALLHLGDVHAEVGQTGAALAYLEEGLSVARDWELRPIAVELLRSLARVREQRGEPAEALRVLRDHDALRDSIFSQSTGQRIAAMEARIEGERQARENEGLREDQRIQEARIARQRVTVLLGGALLLVSLALLAALVHYNRQGRHRERLLAESNSALGVSNAGLRQALSEVRALKGLIPICAHCKKVRGDQGYWEAVETYISERSEALFSHSICTECGPRVYGEDWVGAPDDDDSDVSAAEASPASG